MRVLHAPVNVGNQAWALAEGERAFGVESKVVINYQTWLQYPCDLCLSEAGRQDLKDTFKRASYAMTTPFRFDIMHYYFGRSLMCWDDRGPRNGAWFQDLKLAKRLGRKIFMTLQGCDVRLAGKSDAMNAFTPCRKGNCGAYDTCISKLDAERQWMIDNILPIVDRVFYLNPELGHFVPSGQFLPYITVDWRHFEQSPPSKDGPIRIVHAPSDPKIKGTHLVVDAIERLRQHYDIDFVIVQNKPHQEAMEIYRNADIAIDQMLAGWYGAFAVELMAMGKPTVCYIRQEDLCNIPPEMRDTSGIVNVHPDRLFEDLCALIDDRENWDRRSQEAVDYVKTWHDPQKIAQAMLEAYRAEDSAFDLSASCLTAPIKLPAG